MTAALPLPPGKLGFPLVGETFRFVRDQAQFARDREQYGPVFKTHLFGSPTVVMSGPEALEFVFAHEGEYFGASCPEATIKLLGDHTFLALNGDAHAKRRKALKQVFGEKQIEAHVPVIDRIARRHLAAWEKVGSFAWCPLLGELAFDIACALVLGVDAKIEGLCQMFQTWTRGLVALPVSLPWTAFGRALRTREALIAHIDKLILERMNAAPGSASSPGAAAAATRMDALSVLLRAVGEEKPQFHELRDGLLTLLDAGYDPASSALSSFCMLTAQHRPVLDRLHAEQRRLALDGPLTTEHIRQMPYLDQVLKEVLRFIPPVSGGFRKVIADFEFKGYRIPKGWTVLYSIGAAHHDPTHFADPERFDPDRFGPERAEDKRARFALVPFGGGPHVCLGMEVARLQMSVVCARLARDYDWELVPNQDLHLETVPSPRPKSGLEVRLRKR